MNLFKFLKKRQEYSFENLLQKAADNTKYRAEFIRRIPDENLLIITNSDLGPERLVRLEADTKINVLKLDDGRIPIFTSPERIYDKGIFKGSAKYISANAREIFELLKGATLILNPYSDYGKEFHPDEVERILNKTYFKPQQVEIKKNTKVFIGQPAKYPTEVVESLIKLFSNRPEVRAGYLGWIHDPATTDPPHYIFGIETKGDWPSISDEAGDTVQKILGYGEIVDFIPICPQGFLENYFTEQTRPFYKKAE